MLDKEQVERLERLCDALIDQRAARTIVHPNQAASGYWFGGGSLVEAEDGTLYLSGRYRNAGDSRTGLGAGERGLEVAIFRSMDHGANFEKVLSFSKADLSPAGHPVISLEGTALLLSDGGVELFVSSEKANISLAPGFESYLKANTGVWTIDHLCADDIAGLAHASVEPFLACGDLRYVHVKDPWCYCRTGGDLIVGFCTHPFSWTSSNSAYVVRGAGTSGLSEPDYAFFERGPTWDVAMSRITTMWRIPSVGLFSQSEPMALMFYDGGESLRNLDEHSGAVSRPRGYSCEELGGVACCLERDLGRSQRLSRYLPSFVSPMGTGASRYVNILETGEGIYATWEQSQEDRSQALVMNFIGREQVEEILS